MENQKYMLARDAINGKDGNATLIQDGKISEIFNARNIQVNGDIQIEDFVVVGTRIIQPKPTGLRFNGTMEIYYGSPLFLDMLIAYQNGKALPYFTLQITNDDSTATIGKQTVALLNCCLTGTVPISKLDATSSMMSETVNFAFTKVVLMEKFKEPLNFGQ